MLMMVLLLSSKNSACALNVKTQKLVEGGCMCHKIMSNSQEVMDSAPIEDRAPVKEQNLHKTISLI